MDSRNKRSDKNSELYRAITALDSLDDCYDFLVDLCTQPELKAMEQRYEVARMLDRGMIYSDILAETSASSATISRVNRCRAVRAAMSALLQKSMRRKRNEPRSKGTL